MPKKISYWLIAAVIIFGGGWLLITNSVPKGPDYSAAVEIFGEQHIPEGASYTDYNSNPPASGPHYSDPAVVRFYDQELADEQVVHNLEHGHVWIAYKPNLPTGVTKQLRKLAGGNVIATPRAKNDSDIALVAWGRLDTFNIKNESLDTQRIKDFTLRYQNKGPERLSQPGGI